MSILSRTMRSDGVEDRASDGLSSTNDEVLVVSLLEMICMSAGLRERRSVSADSTVRRGRAGFESRGGGLGSPVVARPSSSGREFTSAFGDAGSSRDITPRVKWNRRGSMTIEGSRPRIRFLSPPWRGLEYSRSAF